ncbi:hypothetical protein H4R24_000572 [Coemansia sp. RSA 988]|nr:hypothetical protein H4R24_000572 [Coemansia sp. RSA 988]
MRSISKAKDDPADAVSDKEDEEESSSSRNSGNAKKLAKEAKNMARKAESDCKKATEMLEKDELTEAEIVVIKNIYKSITDSKTKVERSSKAVKDYAASNSSNQTGNHKSDIVEALNTINNVQMELQYHIYCSPKHSISM